MKNQQIANVFNEIATLLDLSDYHVRMAKRYGVPLVISTDAHINADFDDMEYGVTIARRGWAVSGDVLNTLPCRSLLKKLRSGRNPVASSRDRKA